MTVVRSISALVVATAAGAGLFLAPAANADNFTLCPSGMSGFASEVELWDRLVSEYTFTEAPEKEILLAQAARCADMIARLGRIVDAAGDDIRVRGSQGQPVLAPEIAELRGQRTQLASLLRALALPSGDEDS